MSLSGNLRSRWLDFLITDGEKEDRDRDSEFIIYPEDTRTKLMHNWEEGWNILTDTFDKLKSNDLEKTITIRKEIHTVPLAIQRSLAHTTYHIGQIMYLCRLIKSGEWKWLTIPPGMSNNFNNDMKDRNSNA